MKWFRVIFEKALIQEMTLSFVIIVMCHALCEKSAIQTVRILSFGWRNSAIG